jgi:hypothetical protein
MASWFAFVAAILTPALGLGYLVQVTYIAEQCFRTAFFGGCTNLRTTLLGMLDVAPLQLAAPIAVVLIIAALAFGAWWASLVDRDADRVAGCTAGHAMLTVPLTLIIGPVFVAPALLLIASTLLTCGAKPRVVAVTLAIGTIVVIGAFAGTLAAIALWGVRYGPVPLGAQPMWLYVGLATALGIAAGCLAASRRGAPREFLRALVLAYAGFGAGAVAASLALIPVMYPNGRLVGLGLSGVWMSAWTLLAADLVAGVVVWRWGGRLPWGAAFAATGFCALTFVLAAVATVAVATRIVAGDLTPPIPLLPSTSTSN